MSSTPRLALPFITPGQAQKELFHNEALQALDIVVAAAVEAGPSETPPQSPMAGNCYLVGSQPVGSWSGKAHCIAAFTGGGWRFADPVEGLSAYLKPDGVWLVYRAGGWELGVVRGSSLVLGNQQVVGARQPAIAAPTSGGTVDTEARTAIGNILGALRLHGLIES